MNKKILCPVGTKVQSLIFSKDKFSEKSAKDWAKKHDFIYGYTDEKENTFRIRQQEPSDFTNMRTIEMTKGVKAVIGCPKKYADGGTTSLQKIILSKKVNHFDDGGKVIDGFLQGYDFKDYEDMIDTLKKAKEERYDISDYLDEPSDFYNLIVKAIETADEILNEYEYKKIEGLVINVKLHENLKYDLDKAITEAKKEFNLNDKQVEELKNEYGEDDIQYVFDEKKQEAANNVEDTLKDFIDLGICKDEIFFTGNQGGYLIFQDHDYFEEFLNYLDNIQIDNFGENGKFESERYSSFEIFIQDEGREIQKNIGYFYYAEFAFSVLEAYVKKLTKQISDIQEELTDSVLKFTENNIKKKKKNKRKIEIEEESFDKGGELKGKRVRLIEMKDDKYPVPKDTMGTIDYIDDAGQIHVKWDNGSSLALIPNLDEYEIINTEMEDKINSFDIKNILEKANFSEIVKDKMLLDFEESGYSNTEELFADAPEKLPLNQKIWLTSKNIQEKVFGEGKNTYLQANKIAEVMYSIDENDNKAVPIIGSIIEPLKPIVEVVEEIVTPINKPIIAPIIAPIIEPIDVFEKKSSEEDIKRKKSSIFTLLNIYTKSKNEAERQKLWAKINELKNSLKEMQSNQFDEGGSLDLTKPNILRKLNALNKIKHTGEAINNKYNSYNSALEMKTGNTYESISNGKTDDRNEYTLAKKHGVSVAEIKRQLEKGIKIEKEHIDNPLVRREIALDHIEEIVDYYDRLEKMEKQAKTKHTIKMSNSLTDMQIKSLGNYLINKGLDVNDFDISSYGSVVIYKDLNEKTIKEISIFIKNNF